jgi:hypothetical protein
LPDPSGWSTTVGQVIWMLVLVVWLMLTLSGGSGGVWST